MEDASQSSLAQWETAPVQRATFSYTSRKSTCSGCRPELEGGVHPSFVLDKSVPGILDRFKARGFKWKGDNDVATLVAHQSDVFDKLKLLCGESEYSPC